MSAGAVELLRPQLSIRLPDYITSTGAKVLDAPAEIRWSPDNRYVAISGFSSGKLFLLDIEQKKLIDRDIQFNGGPPNITWSADSSLIALVAVDVALFRAADGKEIFHRRKVRYGGCTSQPRQAGAFTADGQFLWVTCGARSQRGRYRAANKLTVPNLEIADSADTEPNEPENFHSTFSDRMVVENGKILLSSLLSTCGGPQSHLGVLTCYRDATCLDLEAKQPCFPSFSLDRSMPSRGVIDFQVVPSSQQIVSLWGSKEGKSAPSNFAFEVHDFAGNRIRQFGTSSEIGDIPPRDFVVTADGVIVSSVSDLDRRRGGLMAWNANTGALLQSTVTPPAWRLGLSNDGLYLAVIMGLEVKIYSVSKI